MILNLSPEQFLLVYNHISNDNSTITQDLKSKMDLTLLEALSTIDDVKNQLKFSNWMKKEKEKVSNLENELKIIKVQHQMNIPDDGLYFPTYETK